MSTLRPVIYATLSFLVLFGLVAATLRVLLPHWWRVRAVRWAMGALAVATLVSLGVWLGGGIAHAKAWMTLGVHGCWLVLAILLPLTVALVMAGLVWKILARIFLARMTAAQTATATATTTTTTTTATATTEAAPSTRLTRRAVIEWCTAAIPATALAASASGLIAAREEPVLETLRMTFPNLPAELEGLRILQLTDLHLGPYRNLHDLEYVLGASTAQKPDLIVITGDIADDLAQLLPALRLIADVRPRLGVFASLGNHEYFRSILQVKRAFDKSPVPFLVDRGISIDVGGGANLYIGGADDPVRLSGEIDGFMQRTVDAALDGAPSDAFHLMLSHRPAGFVATAARGVDLTLSGHTHGGQVGLFGRSAFEPLWPSKYLRGKYALGKSQLYTSAGFGHWFPFRLNCPPEAPTIVLTRG